MADENDPADVAVDGEDDPGFSDAEIAEQLVPFFAEVDADYEAAFEPIADVFRKKGPPS